ncbi:MAG: hypothetical protein RLZZ341_2120, partial [Pseudomonadota bacterium]
GFADPGLLDTYGQERRDHARSMIHLSEVAGCWRRPKTEPRMKAVPTQN